MTKDQFKAANARRIHLIRAKYAGGLSDAEAAELAGLETAVGDHIEAMCPRDYSVLDEMARSIAAMKAAKAKHRIQARPASPIPSAVGEGDAERVRSSRSGR